MVIIRRIMMKKLIRLLIAVTFVCVLTAGIASCSDVPSESKSPESVSETTSHTHVFDGEWKSDGSYHWRECECGEKSEKEAHVLTAISVKTVPSKTKYLTGDVFDKTGMEIEGTCVCGKVNVTDYEIEYAVNGATSLNYGDTSVKVRVGKLTADVAVTVEKREIAKPVADETSFTYNGKEQTYAVAASEFYTVSGNVQKNAGEYTVTVALKDKEGTSWADKTTDDFSFTFVIKRFGAAVVWNVAEKYVYNGVALAAPTAKIVGADGQEMNLTVSGDEINDKGSYTFTASADDNNYELTNAACTIKVYLYNEITGMAFADIEYGNEPSYDAEELKALHGTPTIVYSLAEDGEYVAWETIEKKIGKYYVKASVEGTDDYISATAFASFNVVKMANRAEIASDKEVYACNERVNVYGTAVHGLETVVIKYATSADGEFSAVMTFELGKTYYAKAVVAEGETYNGAESNVISFSIANHVYKDGKCDVCGEYNTMGVAYAYDEANDCYYVDFNKGLKASDITVLSKYSDGEHEEREVKYVRNSAFMENPYIKRITLPASVTRLDGMVFQSCGELEYVSMLGVVNLESKGFSGGIYEGEGKLYTTNNFLDCEKLTAVMVNKKLVVGPRQFIRVDEKLTPCVVLYADGAKAEVSVTVPDEFNQLFSGNVYAKGNKDKCGEWNYDAEGKIVHGAPAHNFKGETCEICGEYNTMGVAYAYDEVKDCYYVDFNNSVKTADITILSRYNDGEHEEKEVKYVRNEAFQDNTAIVKVIFPESVKRLDGNVFQGCTNLQYVSMTGVAELTLENLSNKGIYGKSVYSTNNFLNCGSLTTVIVGKSFKITGNHFIRTNGDLPAGNADIYMSGSKAEASFVYDKTNRNEHFSGRVYYLGNAENCEEWNYDASGNIVRGPLHSFVDGKCENCGEIQTQGITYGYDSANDVYYVSSYKGEGEVYVLAKYNGEHGEKAVTYVKNGAFQDANITKVVLPANITRLDGSVFQGCINLEYVSMLGVVNLESKALSGGIYEGAGELYTTNNFLNCGKLTTVIVNKALTVGPRQFIRTDEKLASCVVLYADGAKNEVSVSVHEEYNELFSGVIYSKGDAAKCLEWNYDANGNFVHGPVHDFVDGKCENCGEVQTQGITYGYDSANDVYYVSGYTGSAKEVYVLAKYNDGEHDEKAVTYVKNGAFQNPNITKVVLPASVTRLDGSVFQGCGALEFVSMTGITDMAFKNLSNSGIYVGENEIITNNNFLGCEKLTKVLVNKKFNLYADNAAAQQFYTASAAACVDIYVDGMEDESSVNCSPNAQNKLLTGNIYYYSEESSEGTWRYVNGVPTLW